MKLELYCPSPIELQEELILGSYWGCEKHMKWSPCPRYPPSLCSAPQEVRSGEVAKGSLKDPGADGLHKAGIASEPSPFMAFAIPTLTFIS